MDPPDTPQLDSSGSEMEASVKTNHKRKQRLSEREFTHDDEKGEPSKHPISENIKSNDSSVDMFDDLE